MWLESVTSCHEGMVGNDHASRFWKGVQWHNNLKTNFVVNFRIYVFR